VRLRTLDGELVRGKLTTEYPLSTDGFPVLIVKGEPYGPEDADFYLESATTIERKQLAKGGYNLERWSEHGEDPEFMNEEFKDDESLDEESESRDSENGDSEDDK
jgi:hypothetical protein